jgi:O-methyltransferase involved in polyketide biosynthesis
MMARDIDSSSISFTALYTGEIWRRHGLSAPFLSSTQGRFLYLAGRPMEWAGKILLGGNNEVMLLQRHHIIDYLLEKAIEREGVTQIVEIACGLSPRGTRTAQKYAGRNIHFIEADLPDMAARKSHLLEKAGELSEFHRVLPLNILEENTTESLESFFARELDPSRKTLVITEGLVNYFDYATIHGFWTRLAAVLKQFPAGIYLNDLYPNFQWHRSVRTINAFKSFLGAATRSNVTLHFDNEAAIIEGFREAGFTETRAHLPESYYGVLDIPVMPVPSLVRVIESRA